MRLKAQLLLSSIGFFARGFCTHDNHKRSAILHDLAINLPRHEQFFQSVIQQQVSIANANHKKSLIVIGEAPFDRNSLLVELLIAHMSAQFGINRYLIQSRDYMARYAEAARRTPNVHLLINVLKKIQMDIINADSSDKDSSLLIQSQRMQHNLLNLKQNAVLVVDIHMLHYFMFNKDLADQFNVLLINATSGISEKLFSDDCLRMFQLTLIKILLNPQYVLQAKMTPLLDEISLTTLVEMVGDYFNQRASSTIKWPVL